MSGGAWRRPGWDHRESVSGGQQDGKGASTVQGRPYPRGSWRQTAWDEESSSEMGQGERAKVFGESGGGKHRAHKGRGRGRGRSRLEPDGHPLHSGESETPGYRGRDAGGRRSLSRGDGADRELPQREPARKKASPPRPSLLVGDLAQCHEQYQRLQTKARLLEEAESSHVPAFLGQAPPERAKWQELVRPMRYLRETLVSLGEMSLFTLSVYESSAAVCACAGDWGEFIKCLHILLEDIYPALCRLEDAAASSAATSQGASSSQPEGSAAAVASSTGSGAVERKVQGRACRWAEMCGAGVMFFACIPAESSWFEVTRQLMAAPPCLLQTWEVQAALRVVAALQAGDFLAFVRCFSTVGATAQLLMAHRLPAVRRRALVVMSRGYHTIPTPSVQEMLGLGKGPEGLMVLRQCLVESAEARQSGVNPIARALESWPADAQEANVPKSLTFKA